MLYIKALAPINTITLPTCVTLSRCKICPKNATPAPASIVTSCHNSIVYILYPSFLCFTLFFIWCKLYPLRYRLHIAQVLSYKLNGARPALQFYLYTALQLSGKRPRFYQCFLKLKARVISFKNSALSLKNKLKTR